MATEKEQLLAFVQKVALPNPPITHGGQSTFVEDCAWQYITLRDEAQALLESWREL